MYKLNQNNTSKRQNSINKYVTLGEGLLGNQDSFRGEFQCGKLNRSN